MPIWLLALGGVALFAYLARGNSTFAIGQTCYLTTQTTLSPLGVTLQAGTRVYVQTADASGVTEVRTDSGNVGTVPTSALSTTLPAGTSMQVN